MAPLGAVVSTERKGLTVKRITVTVPLADNDGIPFDAEYFRQIDLALIGQFGGLTRVAVTGAWIEDDPDGEGCRRYDDSSVRYEVDTDDEFALDWIRGYCRTLAGVLRQACIYVTSTDIYREFVSP